MNTDQVNYWVNQKDAVRILDDYLQSLQGYGHCTIRLHRCVLHNLVSFLANQGRNRRTRCNYSKSQLIRWMIMDVQGKTNGYAASRLQVVDRYMENLCKNGALPDNPLRRIKPGCKPPTWNSIVTALQSSHPLRELRLLLPRPPRKGPFNAWIQQYIELQQSLGKEYTSHRAILSHCDSFLAECEIYTPRAIKVEHIHRWMDQMRCTKSVRRGNVFIVKRYLDYLMGIGVIQSNPAETAIKECGRVSTIRFRPFIFTKIQILTLLEKARRLPTNHLFRLRPHLCYTILVLIYALGLRSGEVRKLRFCDVDCEQRILRIEGTKFHKSRLIPFGPRVLRCLTAYMAVRRQVFLPIRPEDPLFITYRRHPINSGTLTSLLRQLLEQILPPSSPSPRIHDIRHTFAVHRLLRWYREGADVQSKLLWLSVFMGHTEISSTEVYLTITADLLKEANVRFDQYCGKSLGKEIYP